MSIHTINGFDFEITTDGFGKHGTDAENAEDKVVELLKQWPVEKLGQAHKMFKADDPDFNQGVLSELMAVCNQAVISATKNWLGIVDGCWVEIAAA